MSSAILTKVSAGSILSDAGMTVLIGLVVVFGALIVLTFVFWLFGAVAGNGKTKNKPVASPPAESPKVNSAAAQPPAADSGVPDEVVAVIAAAVAAMSDGTSQYTVRRIRPVRQTSGHPVWAAAGIAENTQPF